MAIHEKAAAGYQVAADAYERGRPKYPDEAVRHLCRALRLSDGKRVLDLGAGTGKFTKLLVPSGAEIVAVEPVAAMREKLKENVPSAVVVEGTAETIPLESQSLDAVVVAQAFHWFDGRAALSEIHRVLKPGGLLGLIWNSRDDTVDWVAELNKLVDQYQGDSPRFATGRWRRAFESTDRFSPLEAKHFDYVHRGPRDMAIDRITSTSFIAALDGDERGRLLDKVRALLASHPMTRDSNEIDLPYRTVTFVTSTLPQL